MHKEGGGGEERRDFYIYIFEKKQKKRIEIFIFVFARIRNTSCVLKTYKHRPFHYVCPVKHKLARRKNTETLPQKLVYISIWFVNLLQFSISQPLPLRHSIEASSNLCNLKTVCYHIGYLCHFFLDLFS